MPFVPLGSRKPLPVILDDDKARLTQQQREKDEAVIAANTGVAPGRSGYRFANHPATMGGSRRSPTYQGGSSTWRPPELDPGGPAEKRDRMQAATGAFHEGSHSMRRPQSLPTLRQEDASEHTMMDCHPVATELKRLTRLATMTEKNEMKTIERKSAPPPPPPKQQSRGFQSQGGLVNFPKYMLINSCHLKTQDLIRYHKEQEELLAKSMAAAEAPEAASSEHLSPISRTSPSPSWGAS